MVIPTSCLLLVTLFGLIPMALSGSPQTAVYVALVWLAGAAVLGALDALTVPGWNGLEWKREHESKLSLGAPNPVTLRLLNRTGRRALFRVRDAVPAPLIPRGEASSGECGPGDDWAWTYTVFPVRRGDYAFGPVTARYRGVLGLAWRQHAHRFEDAVKVYPNLLAIRTYEALARRGQLQEIGLRRSRRVGAGTEFERLRDYTPDDEFRRINWSATARRHAPIAVDYQTERRQNVILALDTGRLMSMQVPVPESQAGPPPDPETPLMEVAGVPVAGPALTRLDYTVNASLLLAYVAEQHGDCVGLLAFDDRVTRYLAPRPGRRQFLAVADALYNLEAGPVEADYAAGLGYLAGRLSRRSLVVALTDLVDPDSASVLAAQIILLTRRHLVLVAVLRDPSIERLATQPPADSPGVYQRAVARSVLDEREDVLHRLRRHGVLTLDVPADGLSPSLVNRYLEIKARARL